MSELLLQTIVEKLESLELAWKVSGDTEKETVVLLKKEIEFLRNDLKKPPAQILPSTAKLGELSVGIDNLNRQLQVPLQNRVEHTHELHKGVLISISLFLLSVVLVWALLNSYQYNKQYKANDLKYRYLKVANNAGILKLCNFTDSLYQKNEDSFKTGVEQEEQRLLQQAENFRIAGEKEREAKSLKSRAGRR
ncbi:MAG: hypothetical protein ABIQ27_10930 [Flavobacterium sp.]|uniref:hypothetical protein n=1 Tax=Flavobacterium sp. TaxID=239 RepID=UPI003266046C